MTPRNLFLTKSCLILWAIIATTFVQAMPTLKGAAERKEFTPVDFLTILGTLSTVSLAGGGMAVRYLTKGDTFTPDWFKAGRNASDFQTGTLTTAVNPGDSTDNPHGAE